MIKNKLRLTLKLFLILWILLFLQVILKLTFNYWQPYVIPTPQLEMISDFIDSNKALIVVLDGVFYIFNAIIMILCSIQQWWFKNKKQSIIVISIIILSYIYLIIFGQSTILSIILNFSIPLIINSKKWLYIILTFIFSNLFLLLSLWLEGFTSSNDMSYIVATFLNIDYYIMLVLNYMLFNFIRIRKENKK